MHSNQQQKGKPNADDAIIGESLKGIRILKGLSQQNLAELMGVSSQQIQKYEKGSNRISASRLLRLSNALDVDFELFYGALLDNKKDIKISFLDPKILKIVNMLANIEDEKLLNQVTAMLKIMIANNAPDNRK